MAQQNGADGDEWSWEAEPGRDERARITARRGALSLPQDVNDPSKTVGLALSGGGIRSATVSLGILQSLARHRLLETVDYLSTVSGGGYIGAFFMSLFARDKPNNLPCPAANPACPQANQPKPAGPSNPEQAYEVLRGSYSKPQEHNQVGQQGQHDGSALWWLRSSGRYLAPTGAGDFVYAVAMQFRNWLALHIVLGMAILLVAGPIIAADAKLRLIFASSGGDREPLYAGMGLATLALAVLLVWVLPVGFACFTCEMPKRTTPYASWWFTRTSGVVLVAAMLFAGLAWPEPLWPPLQQLVDGLHLTAFRSGLLAEILTGLALLLVLAIAMQTTAALAVAAGRYLPGDKNATAALSPQGQMQSTRVVLTKWLATALKTAIIFALAAAIVALSFWVTNLEQSDWIRFGLPPTAAATAILSIRKWAESAGKFAKSDILKRMPLDLIALIAGLGLLTIVAMIWFIAVWHASAVINGVPIFQLCEPDKVVGPALTIAGFMLAIGLAVAKSFQFLNMSTLQSLYSSRLTRAYLGATNALRTVDKDQRWTRISDLHPADDLTLERYYRPDNYAPLHLINVTLNETVSPTDPLVQRDRHGRPMSITPTRYSIDGRFFERALLPHTLNASAGSRYRYAFARSQVESLSVGQWISISGAAFSTGVGRQTSLGKSLALGLANVRLGHWWSAGSLARRAGKDGLDKLLSKVARIFETQAYLFAELLARYSGRYARYWYLSDGGHFENTGLYELLRRKVGLVIASDNGADPDYASDDLANAMRLTRIDFGCEFVELTPVQLRASPMTSVLTDTVIATNTGKGQFADAACMRVLWAYRQEDLAAQQAEFIKAGTAILLFKPRLISALPLDVRQYAATHAAFPQEPTADQFFSEEQWESYRKMGQTLGDSLSRLPGVATGSPAQSLQVLMDLRAELGTIAFNALP
ncbi:patatin-like phospholipase family protein [Chitinimonas sp.]|uniref:patatin-like phospholipase family protein n=1 Tax=Chitinimonas sp. TaxID=1934313 RepID=UPI002F93F438